MSTGETEIRLHAALLPKTLTVDSMLGVNTQATGQGATLAERRDIAALAREYSAEGIGVLVSIMRDDNAADIPRIACVKLLLDRGYGTPAPGKPVHADEESGVQAPIINIKVISND